MSSTFCNSQGGSNARRCREPTRFTKYLKDPSNLHLLRCSSCPTEERTKLSVNPKPVSRLRPIPLSKMHKLGLCFGSEKSSNRQEPSAVNSGNKLGLAPVTIPAVKQSPVRLPPEVLQKVIFSATGANKSFAHEEAWLYPFANTNLP